MNNGTIRSLEFDRIVEAVRSFALTPLGATGLAALRPLAEPHSVQTALVATSECVRYLESNPPLALQAPSDLERALTALAVEAQALDPAHLLGIADFLTSLGTVRRGVAKAEGGPYPALRTILDGCLPFDQEVKQIRTAIDPREGVVDDASRDLKAIRDRLRRQRSRLRGTLDSYLRGTETAKYLQEQVVTERNGRYVLVVKSEHRNAIPGIVHGSSGSGASLFLEPLSTVEINNDIVALEHDEHREVHRILLSLANLLRQRALDLRTTLTAATEIDVVQARATFSQLVDGVEPDLSTDAGLTFIQARHPLLIPAVRQRLGAVGNTHRPQPIPNDIHLPASSPALVVTGPNTGGKTVALKTAGLLTLMVQAGLLIPVAAGSRTTVFRTVFADIGDEQSIASNLSTFSAHIANIVATERRLSLPALVLLDEIGAGTDPLEGGVLGAAVVDHFRQRGALVMVTTHNDALTSYASTTPGVRCAGFGFDPETFAPSYRLAYDTPGRSLALEIAARLGMAQSIIDAARRRRGEREAQLADHLAKIDDDRRRLETDRQKLADDHQLLSAERDQFAADQRSIDELKAMMRERLSTGIDEQVRTARLAIDSVVEELKTNAAALEQTVAARTKAGRIGLSTGDLGTLKSEARTAVDSIARRAASVDTGPEIDASPVPNSPATNRPDLQPLVPPTAGSRVTVGALGLEGHLLSVHGEQAEVDLRGKRLHISLHELRVAGGSADGDRNGSGGPGKVTVKAERHDGPLPDLNVIGYTVDEARARVDKYLDRALIQEQRHVRIIHGHGTGRLRRSIGELLDQHPHVERSKPAPPEQGGSGVTVVELKE